MALKQVSSTRHGNAGLPPMTSTPSRFLTGLIYSAVSTGKRTIGRKRMASRIDAAGSFAAALGIAAGAARSTQAAAPQGS